MRSDLTARVLAGFQDALFRGVGAALGAGVDVAVHRGTEGSDVRHADLLARRFSGSTGGGGGGRRRRERGSGERGPGAGSCASSSIGIAFIIRSPST